ncbi:hypothetical protein DFJ73DRAFT_762432 [Zopfochytrium polystomum]|nr:hypothetical protein DFJ73DRAFT_762432 [Zopfochytrium polystomum]
MFGASASDTGAAQQARNIACQIMSSAARSNQRLDVQQSLARDLTSDATNMVKIVAIFVGVAAPPISFSGPPALPHLPFLTTSCITLCKGAADLFRYLCTVLAVFVIKASLHWYQQQLASATPPTTLILRTQQSLKSICMGPQPAASSPSHPRGACHLPPPQVSGFRFRAKTAALATCSSALRDVQRLAGKAMLPVLCQALQRPQARLWGVAWLTKVEVLVASCESSNGRVAASGSVWLGTMCSATVIK